MPKERPSTSTLEAFFEKCSRTDGRGDHHVLDYSVNTFAIQQCISKKIPLTVIVGIKGIGKSTAFKILASRERTDLHVAGFSPGTDRFSKLSQTKAGIYRERYYAYLLMAAVALFDKDSWKATFAKPVSGAMKQIRQRWKGVSSPFGGVSFDLSEDEEKKLDQLDRNKFQARLTALYDGGVTTRLFVDDPDQIMPPGESGKHALAGLVLAADEINTNLSGSFGVTVLLKTHVLQEIRTNEEVNNILPTQIGRLTWTPAELLEAVDSRLNDAKCKYDEAFAFNKKMFESKILSELRNGPRDLFAWIALAANASKQKKLTFEHFDKARKSLATYSLDQVASAYSESVPNLARMIKIIFKKGVDYSYDELVKRIKELRINNEAFIELAPSGVLPLTEDYIKFFIDAGTLEIVRNDNSVVEPFDSEYSEVDSSESGVKLRLHPLLATALHG